MIKQTRYCPPVDELAETDQLSNQDSAGVDQAIVYLFRVDHQAKELVEASRTYAYQQNRISCEFTLCSDRLGLRKVDLWRFRHS